jgi:DNA polymerase family B
VKRYPHYWWNVRGKYCPSRIAVLDCDTTPDASLGTGQPCPDTVTRWMLRTADMRGGERVGGLIRSGESLENLWQSLSRLCISREVTWVFVPECYRILTAIGFWYRLEDGRVDLCGKDWKVERGKHRSGEDKADGLCVIADPPTLISCRPHGTEGKLLFLDTRNYGLETPKECNGAVERCGRYLPGLCDIVQSLRQGIPVSLRGTAASQAMQALRTRHDCVRLHCHTHAPALALERAAYYGGRCECFRLGPLTGPIYHLDIRNCYPAVCLDLAIPVSLRSYTDEPGRAKRYSESVGPSVIAHVRIRSDVSAYPYRRKGDVVYPIGEYDTCLAGPEIVRACAENAITRWYSAAEYTCAPYLRDFMREWLLLLAAARARGATHTAQWIKRVMNALPGKFAEPGRRWVPCPARTERGPYGEWTEANADGSETRYRNIAWHTMRLEETGESYWSMPSVAAWITSAARIRLWSYIETAGRANVWYVDTDSIICGQAGYDRLLRSGLIRDGETGYLRLIGQHSKGFIHGIRHYQLDHTVSCSGVERGDILPGESRPDYFRRVKASTEIALGYRPGTAGVESRPSEREGYRHGVVGPDGTVTPLRIDDE